MALNCWLFLKYSAMKIILTEFEKHYSSSKTGVAEVWFSQIFKCTYGRVRTFDWYLPNTLAKSVLGAENHWKN